MSEAVVITGIGIVSPFGGSITELTELTEDRIQSAPAPVALQIPEIPLTAVPAEKRARIGRLDRLCRVLLSASYLAMDDAGLEIAPADAERVGLSFGTGFGCLLTNAEYYQKIVESGPAAASPRLFAYTVSSAAAGEVSIALGIKGPNVTTHMGFAAGLGAVGYGFDLIQMGKADVVLAGGADVIGPALIDGLRDMGLLKTRECSRPFVDEVPGVWPSESAVVFVLERAERARGRGAPRRERRGRRRCIDGYAAGFEPTLTRHARESIGMVATMRRALALSGHQANEVDVVMSSAHGTPIDAVERAAMTEVFGDHRPRVVAPKGSFGEMFAGSGVLALALATAATRGRPFPSNKQDRPLIGMVNAVCYSGTIVSAIVGGE